MNLPTWISNLSHPDEAERLYAAEDIGYSNDPAGILPLVTHLKSEQSAAVKETMISALTRMDHDEVISEAVGLFESEDAYLRNQAAALLAQRGKAAISHLLRAMASPDSNVRKLALDVIGQIRAPETRDILEAALRDADANIVITSVEHIGATQCRELKVRIEELLETATEPMLVTALLETLCAIGDEASLRVALGRFSPIEEASEFFQYSLVKMLGELGNLTDSELLCSVLTTRGPRVFPQILDAFAHLKERYPNEPLPTCILSAVDKHLSSNLTDLQSYQTVMLLRPFSLDPNVAPVWRKALALRRLKRPDLCHPLEPFDNSPQ